ncbi:MAG: hypothetical protein II917_00105 [Synergistaceae bacterium]|nr:hypothetical protein [Synergistaceae bacterium]
MAKIKFNLNFGGEHIRTLDDLRDNFSIEDILDVYNNGLLVKWLVTFAITRTNSQKSRPFKLLTLAAYSQN